MKGELGLGESWWEEDTGSVGNEGQKGKVVKPVAYQARKDTALLPVGELGAAAAYPIDVGPMEQVPSHQ